MFYLQCQAISCWGKISVKEWREVLSACAISSNSLSTTRSNILPSSPFYLIPVIYLRESHDWERSQLRKVWRSYLHVQSGLPGIISSQRTCWDFCDIRDKSAVFNILQQNVMHFDVGNGKRGRKWRKREEIEREWGNVESQSLSISSFSLHFLIFSPFPPHFLILSPFPRSQAARLPQFVQPWLRV